jgi:putative ABC transport system substrate-binding protein
LNDGEDALNRRGALAGLLLLGAVAARAQKPRTVGYLSNGADASTLERGLAARGYAIGRDLRVVVQVTERDDAALEAKARALLATDPDVLVAWGARNVNVLARLTRTVPIVCGGTADPVAMGYAKSIHRPGGNVTGISYGVPEMAHILVGLMIAVRPGLKRVSAFVRGGGMAVESWGVIIGSLGEAARARSVSWEIVPVSTRQEFERGLDDLDPRTSAVYVVELPDLDGRDAAQALIRRRLASSTSDERFVRRGALMHYSVDHADVPARVAEMIDALLRGAKAAQLPFQLPDRTTFILNRGTARAIGLALPPEVLARATEVLG